MGRLGAWSRCRDWCAIGLMAVVLLIQSGEALAGPSWKNLNPTYKELLEPLKSDWDGLSDFEQEQYLRLGKKYASESPQRRAMMRERFGTWTQLSPAEKAAARKNYKSLKEQNQADKNTRWNNYQSMDASQREELKAKLKQQNPAAPNGRRKPGNEGKLKKESK